MTPPEFSSPDGHRHDPVGRAAANQLLMRAMVDELCRCGMEAACTCPGSRNTPILLALAREQRLSCFSHIDERCAGFFALGLAKASGLPVAVTCTSGTAVAELLPAAVEAHEARVPLIVLSADRPPHLRQVGAGQTIDQVGILGSAAKWFFEVDTAEADERSLRWIRTIACRAYWTALEGRPGVVHLNIPLREPLLGDESPPEDPTARPGLRPYVARPPAAHGDVESLQRLLEGSSRGVVVAGRYERATDPDGLGEAVASLCKARGWPLLADPLSGARRGRCAIAHYDALLRERAFAARMRPDLVIRVGDLPTSKPLRAWLAGLDATHVALDPEGAWQDPDTVLCQSIALDPIALADLVDQPAGAAETEAAGAEPADAEHVDAETAGAEPAGAEPAGAKATNLEPGGWLRDWLGADALAAGAIDTVLSTGGLSEPAVARELGALLPSEATLFVSSSMPVRDIETFWPVREDPPRALSNRGANGIDGTVSSAFGAVAARRGPVVLLIGDVALAHDIGGLLASGRLGLKLTIVLVNNGGGGIFDFLAVAANPEARQPTSAGAPGSPDMDMDADADVSTDTDVSRGTGADTYTQHIATPTGLDFSAAAELYGLEHLRPEDIPTFREALEHALASPRSTILEVPGERQPNLELHIDLWDAVARALTA